jgi:lysozyme family protein
MENFQRAYGFTQKWEGGSKFTQDPNDPGGATKYGVSFRFLEGLPLDVSDIDKNGKLTWKDVQALSAEDAEAIYKFYFWDALKLDSFNFDLAAVLFDTAVNIGKKRAVKALQDVTGSTPDGIIGPRTIEAALNSNQQTTAKAILFYRETYYLRLFKSQKWAAKYIDGWLNRVCDLYQFLKYDQLIG